jgi:hypothetical protein
MKSYGKLFFLVALSSVVTLVFFADRAWAPPLPYCGDGELNQPSEDCEVGIPCGCAMKSPVCAVRRNLFAVTG